MHCSTTSNGFALPLQLFYLGAILLLSLAGCVTQTGTTEPPSFSQKTSTANIISLDDLSINRLRQRRYGSTLEVLEQKPNASSRSMLASYYSDGLRLYSRIDIPKQPEPIGGYPVAIFIHGYRGIELAPSLEFYFDPESYYHDMIEGYINAGFVVFSPGLRGHATINNVPADGIEYMKSWDNGSYLSPVFYAIDVLNLIDSLDSFTQATLDMGSINMVAHSQGGDTALLALAIAGENSQVKQSINAASIWSGCIAPRFTQLETYAPMQESIQAFVAGDGQWNGTAVGADGTINPHFIFPYPADYVATTDFEKWTWQKDSWSDIPVKQVLEKKLTQMYTTINSHTANINDASFKIDVDGNGRSSIEHDPRVVLAMQEIDAFNMAPLLSEKITLHYSDRDFYSLPTWNEDLCQRVNQAGGHCVNYSYPENTHSLRVSEHAWFSSDKAVEGLPIAIKRDQLFFTEEH